MPSLNDVLAVILGGGQGKRLYPLTMLRSNPLSRLPEISAD